MEIKIYIPTYKRADKIITHKLFKNVVVVCPESQLEEYKKNIGGKGVSFIACPDEIEGNIARKRNWIRDNNENKYFIMIDDDIKHFQYIEGRKQYKLEGERLYGVLENGFIMAEELGTVLWGFNLLQDPQAYRECTPFNLSRPVLGPLSCHIKNELRYDESLSLKEDYDYSLQVLQKHHKILRMNKYSYVTDHLVGSGGCISYRTLKKEEEQNIMLRKKWGSKVISFNMKKSVNPQIKKMYDGA